MPREAGPEKRRPRETLSSMSGEIPSEARSGPAWKNPPTAAPLLVVLLALLAYVNTLPNSFVFDDLTIIVKNDRLRTWSGLGPLLVSNYWEAAGESIERADRLWRPLTLASYWLNARVMGLSAWGFHFANILLHAAVSLLVYGAARRLSLGIAGAAAAGVLFALHPIHTEAVASVVGRAELLAALFFLAALIAWIRDWNENRVRAAAATGLLVFLGLACKENVATFPLVMALAAGVGIASWKGLSESLRARRGVIVGGVLSVGVACVLYLLLRTRVLGSLRFESPRFIPGLLYEVPVTHRWWTAAAVFARYAWLMVWPANLSADYSYDAISPVTEWLSPVALAGFAVVIGCVAGMLLLWRRSPPAAFGLGFYLATFALTSNFLFPIKTAMAERLTYLPSAGLAWAAGAGIGALWRRSAGWRGVRGVLIAVGVLIGVALYARTVMRNVDWASNERLFQSVVNVEPRCARGHFNLGDVYRVELKDYKKAIQSYRRALEILPNDAAAYRYIADCNLYLGRPEEAIVALEKALEIKPDDASAHAQLGAVRARLYTLRDSDETTSRPPSVSKP